MVIMDSQCQRCKNYRKKVTCLAFPKQIPDDILIDKFDHKKPLPDQDNDIVFEKIKE